MNIANEDIVTVVVEVPEGHLHIRTRITLADGQELVFQEAAMSNILRAFMAVKTHPQATRVTLKGQRLDDLKRGYAPWQLLEVEDEDIQR